MRWTDRAIKRWYVNWQGVRVHHLRRACLNKQTHVIVSWTNTDEHRSVSKNERRVIKPHQNGSREKKKKQLLEIRSNKLSGLTNENKHWRTQKLASSLDETFRVVSLIRRGSKRKKEITRGMPAWCLLGRCNDGRERGLLTLDLVRGSGDGVITRK
jgi:hypothetical protein